MVWGKPDRTAFVIGVAWKTGFRSKNSVCHVTVFLDQNSAIARLSRFDPRNSVYQWHTLFLGPILDSLKVKNRVLFEKQCLSRDKQCFSDLPIRLAIHVTTHTQLSLHASPSWIPRPVPLPASLISNWSKSFMTCTKYELYLNKIRKVRNVYINLNYKSTMQRRNYLTLLYFIGIRAV